MKVIVGEAEAARRAPIFGSEMDTVVFRPDWNVPDSICVLHGLAKDGRWVDAWPDVYGDDAKQRQN
jgi:hypothetical protein